MAWIRMSGGGLSGKYFYKDGVFKTIGTFVPLAYAESQYSSSSWNRVASTLDLSDKKISFNEYLPSGGGNPRIGTLFSDVAIDLTNINSITAHCESFQFDSASSWMKMLVTSAKSSTFTASKTSSISKASTYPCEITLDVSSLSGEYYLGFESATYSYNAKTVLTSISYT